MPLFSLFVECKGIGSYSAQCMATSPYEAIREFLRGGSLRQFLSSHAEWPNDFSMRDIYGFVPLEDFTSIYFCGLGQKGKYVEIVLAQTVRRSSRDAKYCGPRRKSVTLR
jgi:hypothetical protein